MAARRGFGGGIADWAFIYTPDGTVVRAANATVWFYDALTGGTRITDLTDSNGGAISAVVTDANGEIGEFYGPPYVGRIAADANSGAGPRRWLQSTDERLVWPSGDTTGTTDTAKIQVALDNGAAWLDPGGTYYINAPLEMPANSVLDGGHGAYGPTVVPAAIHLAAAFSGTQAIGFPATGGEQEIRNLCLDATDAGLPAGTCYGVNVVNTNRYVKLRYVDVLGAGFSNGIRINSVAGFSALRVSVRGTNGACINAVSATDSDWTNVQVTTSATSSGWIVDGCCNSRFTSCRADRNTIVGFSVTGTGWGTGAGSGGAVFTGCTTDRNTQSGFSVSATGNGPIVLAGCSFRRDGSDGNAARAGLLLSSATTPVVVTGLGVYPGPHDDGTGNVSPALGVSVISSNVFSLETGYVHGVTGGISFSGTTDHVWVGPGVVQATGTNASPTITSSATLGGFKRLTGVPGTTAGTLTRTTITDAQAEGCTGLDLDPRCVWDATAGLDLHNLSNFRIRMGNVGSVGWGGAVSYAGGYIDTGSGQDGIQLWSDGSPQSQGIIFENCVIRGSNSRAVVHLGGQQRRCGFPGTYIENTNAVRSTVAAGSDGVNVTTFAGAGTLNVASSASFATSGFAVVQTVIGTARGMATLSYTGKGSGTLTGVTCLGGAGTLATGGTVGQGAFGLLADTGLRDANSENNDFGPQLTVVGGNCAVGYSVGDQTQHCNDSLASGLTTAAGLVSIVCCVGSNIMHTLYYDRSSPELCTVACHGGVLNFHGGEALNGDATAPHDVCTDNGAINYRDRTLTQVNATNTQVLSGGRLNAYGRFRAAGNCVMAGTSYLNISDVACSLANYSVTGTAGTVYYSDTYMAGTAGADLTGFSGNKKRLTWTTV